jgi:hypothetical protein
LGGSELYVEGAIRLEEPAVRATKDDRSGGEVGRKRVVGDGA